MPLCQGCLVCDAVISPRQHSCPGSSDEAEGVRPRRACCPCSRPAVPVPVVLDHLLLSRRQVTCHPHTLSLQLMLAFGQDVHFVRPLGKLGYDGLWFGVAIVVVVVATAVCTDDVITRPLFVRHGVMQKFKQCFCASVGAFVARLRDVEKLQIVSS